MQCLIGGGMGGAETFFVRLGRALHQRGIPQHLVLTPNEHRESYLKTHNVPHTVLTFERWKKLQNRWKVRQLVKQQDPDIFISWMNRAGRYTPSGRHVSIARIGGYYSIPNYGRCDVIVVNSPELGRHSEEGGRPDWHLIANFAELGRHAPVDRSAIRRPLIFAAGRLHIHKGFDILIRALARTDAHLWIAGRGGAEGESLRALVEQLNLTDRVEFLGWRPDIPSLLAAADLVVMPSRIEGTSNALLEAMSAAKPIVTTGGRSVSWFLEDGVDARIVQINDVAATASAINELISDPEKAMRLGQAARAKCEAQFSEEAICREWIALFENLAAGNYSKASWLRKQLRSFGGGEVGLLARKDELAPS